ncbi:UNVERIFIED_CONTAM: hypothetical protein FKN15_063073 [Acipenser sinensis]
MNTRCPPKCEPSADCFFSHCRATMQPPQSYSVGGQRSSGQLTGKPAGARPDYRGRWCASIASADMDFNQLEAFLTAQTKKQGGVSAEQAAVLSKFWKNHKSKIRESLISQSRWDNSLRNVSWRVDLKTQSRHTDQVSAAVAVVELELGKTGKVKISKSVIHCELESGPENPESPHRPDLDARSRPAVEAILEEESECSVQPSFMVGSALGFAPPASQGLLFNQTLTVPRQSIGCQCILTEHLSCMTGSDNY